jgi:hypothetical protein
MYYFLNQFLSRLHYSVAYIYIKCMLCQSRIVTGSNGSMDMDLDIDYVYLHTPVSHLAVQNNINTVYEPLYPM